MEKGQSLLFCLVKLGKKVFWFISVWMLMGLAFVCVGFIMYLVWGSVHRFCQMHPASSGVLQVL